MEKISVSGILLVSVGDYAISSRAKEENIMQKPKFLDHKIVAARARTLSLLFLCIFLLKPRGGESCLI